MALWIKSNGAVDTVTPAVGEAFTLEELQRIVGGYIEIVRATAGRWMVLNEDGKRLDLPLNIVATVMYHAAGGREDDVIVGDVLVATRREVT